MLNQLLIKKAIDEDAKNISQMICENAEAILLPHYNESQWNIFKKYYSPDVVWSKIREQCLFCGELDGRIVSTIALDKDFVVGFYTRLEYLNRGIGKRMMQYLEKVALEKGLTQIRLAASPEALSFYCKNGWEKIKDITTEHYGVGFKETLMIKQLKSDW